MTHEVMDPKRDLIRGAGKCQCQHTGVLGATPLHSKSPSEKAFRFRRFQTDTLDIILHERHNRFRLGENLGFHLRRQREIQDHLDQFHGLPQKPGHTPGVQMVAS